MSGTQAKFGETIATAVSEANFEDANLQSSPFLSSSIPPGDDAEEQLSVRVIALVREQDLEGKICMRVIRSQFSSLVTSYATYDGILRLFTSDQGKIPRYFIYPHLQFRSKQYQGNYGREKIHVFSVSKCLNEPEPTDTIPL